MTAQKHPTQGPGHKGNDPLLLNKVAGGILSAGLIVWISIHLAGALTGSKEVKKPVIATATAHKAASGGGVPSINGLIAKADVTKGKNFMAQQCEACHTVTKGGAAGVGPNLYGVMGDKMFAKAGYNFSGAVKKVASGAWTYQKMNEWLDDPQKFAPGTRMGYPGIKHAPVRADVVAYLRTLSDNPIPLPKPGSGGSASGTKAAAASSGPSSGAPVIKPLYAKADTTKGKNFFEQQCAACHTITKGGANGVGPNLYGVVGSPMFDKAGFSFSSAAKKAAHGKWTLHELNEWLYNPMKDVPGTHMGYPGIKNNQTRADVVAYLNAQSGSPEKLK